MNADGRVKTDGWLPRAVAHAGDILAVDPGGMEGDSPAVATYCETITDQTPGFNLKTFDRAIDVTNGAAGAAFLPKHVPRFQRSTKFDVDIALSKIAYARETEFKMRG